MSSDDQPIDGRHRKRAGRKPGPYGTNVGDIWTMEGSSVGDRLIKEKNLLGIHEVMEDDKGDPEERIYCVDLDNPDVGIQSLITRAREGLQKWVKGVAARN